jgi:hypothetical protein
MPLALNLQKVSCCSAGTLLSLLIKPTLGTAVGELLLLLATCQGC